MHAAAAFQKPQIALFGSTVEELGFFPLNPHAKVLENATLSCRPCSHIGRSECPQKHFKCMLEIKPQAVFDNLLHLMPDQ
jgi:heptosyltransferase-2